MPAFYKLVNNRTGHYYLGVAQWPVIREGQHLKEIAAGKKPKLWKRLWKENPELRDPSLWRLVVIREYKTLERAAEREAQALQAHVGHSLCLNSYRTGHKQGGLTPVSRDNMSKVRRGKPKSDEWKSKMSDIKRGEKNPMYGKPGPNKGKKFSDEAKRKMSEAKKAYWARKREERQSAQGSAD